MVNKNSGQTVRYFRRGEVPPGYSGDYILIDDSSSSGTGSRYSKNSSPAVQNNRYQSTEDRASSYSQSNTSIYPNNDQDRSYGSGDPVASTRSASIAATDTARSRPAQQTPTDAAIFGALGAVVIGASLFLVIWLLKLLLKGARKVAAVSTEGVQKGTAAITGSVVADSSSVDGFSPMRAYIALLWIMTLVGLAGLPYPYYVILRVGFIVAFIVAINELRRPDRPPHPTSVWPYVGLAIFIFAWGLPIGLWVVIDIVFLVLLYRLFWNRVSITGA